MLFFRDKVIVITGGTGSLGKVLVKHFVSQTIDRPRKIVVFSRDEAKQHLMRLELEQKKHATDEIIYQDYRKILEFRIGDIRNYNSVCQTLEGADIVINAAALKQVPSCEYFPSEAIETNITGARNIVRAIKQNRLPVETVIGISTDKACKPVNVMGMTKALQERIFITANINSKGTRYICVRYGNVLASRGSVIPVFHEQIRNGGPITITTPAMTRFLLPLQRAVETIIAAYQFANPGEIFIPLVPSARIIDIAKALIGERHIKMVFQGIRPGEKTHEILVSQEEIWNAYQKGDYIAIKPMLPEITQKESVLKPLEKEYSSADNVLSLDKVKDLLFTNYLTLEQVSENNTELLR